MLRLFQSRNRKEQKNVTPGFSHELSDYVLENDRANVTKAIYQPTGETVIIKRYSMPDEAERTAHAAMELKKTEKIFCPNYLVLKNNAQPYWRERKNDGSYTMSEYIPGEHDTFDDTLSNLPSGVETPLVQTLISEALEISDILQEFAAGIETKDGVIVYDHQDIGTHNLYLDENGVLFLIDIEGHHFQMFAKTKFVPAEEKNNNKWKKMLLRIVVSISNNYSLSEAEKYTILEPWMPEIELDQEMSQLLHFNLKFQRNNPAAVEKERQKPYQRKSSW